MILNSDLEPKAAFRPSFRRSSAPIHLPRSILKSCVENNTTGKNVSFSSPIQEAHSVSSSNTESEEEHVEGTIEMNAVRKHDFETLYFFSL
jgi:hypothetical protein